MALSNFLSKLNWRLMLVHFIACWFVCHALWQLGFLYDYSYLEKLTHNYYNQANNYKGFDARRLSMDLYYAGCLGLAGILISVVISLLLSTRNKWFWLNSIVVLPMGLVSSWMDRFYWNHVKFVFMFPGIPFKSDWWFNFIGGMFMLTIGLTLFFWKRIIKFIDGRKADPIEAA